MHVIFGIHLGRKLLTFCKFTYNYCSFLGWFFILPNALESFFSPKLAESNISLNIQGMRSDLV